MSRRLMGSEIKVYGRDILEYRGVKIFRTLNVAQQKYIYCYGKCLCNQYHDLYQALLEIDNMLPPEEVGHDPIDDLPDEVCH